MIKVISLNKNYSIDDKGCMYNSKGIIKPKLSTITRSNEKRPIEQYDLKGKLLHIYPSVKEARRQTNIQMKGALSGRYKTACGYIWKYKL